MEAEIFGGGDNAENAGQAVDDGLPTEFATMSADDIARRARLLDNEVRVLRDEATRLNLEQANLTEKVRGNAEGGGKEGERERIKSIASPLSVTRRPSLSSIDARRNSALLTKKPSLGLQTSSLFQKKKKRKKKNRSRRIRKRSSSTTSSPTSSATSSRSSTPPPGKGPTARTRARRTARRPTPTPGGGASASSSRPRRGRPFSCPWSGSWTPRRSSPGTWSG